MAIFTSSVLASSLLLSAMVPDPRMAIALRVAGQGLPNCTSYLEDGSERPCLPRFAVRSGSSINGWSEHGRIEFSRAALERLTPDEFALLAGHEIAHWYLGHKGSNVADELAADRLGAQLACQAGYDPAAGTGLFRYLHQGTDHPPRKLRVAAVLEMGCAAPAPRPAFDLI
jgi:Peptidase family M48